MATYQANGARLGWLLIPEQRAVEVWGPLGEPAAVPQRLAPASQIDGSCLFPGLLIDLQEIWAA
jgi:Uma2 family endonuclease